MTKYSFPICFIGLLFCLSCSKLAKERTHTSSSQTVISPSIVQAASQDTIRIQLQKPACGARQPLKENRLRVLMIHSLNSYFVYDGQDHGLEYEILSLYAKKKNLTVEIVTVDSYKQLYDSVSHGNFDMVAGTLLKTSGMDSIIPFSNELYKSDVIIATAKSLKELEATDDAHHVIHYSPLYFFAQEDTIRVHKIPYDLNKELALEKVANQEYATLMVDRHEFRLMKAYFPQLTEIKVLQKNHPISFGFNPHSKDLQKDFNGWLAKNKNSSDYAWTHKKYDDFAAHIGNKLKYEQPSIWQGEISKYDHLIKEYAQKYELDWKLVAALVNQESKFNAQLVSPVGAKGLMQIMPSVAKSYNYNPSALMVSKSNVAIGTRYLKWLYDHFDQDPLLTEDNKIKFTLAAYNGGIGHITDARALANKYHLNPNEWDNNVELMLTRKSHRKYYADKVVQHGHSRGWETRIYVKNILMYYQHYQNFLPEATVSVD